MNIKKENSITKVQARAFGALVGFVLFFFFTIPIFVDGMESSTNVSVIVQGNEITSQTEDCVLDVGDDQELMIGTLEDPDSYSFLWEMRANEAESWREIARTQTYEIVNAQLNSPATTPYQYRVTITGSSGVTDNTIISILVSDGYDYRTISLRNGDTDVSAYMHDQTRLVVTPLSDSSAATTELEEELSDDCLPLLICDVSLVNQNNQVVPYFGAIQVDFHVGSEFNGQTLKAYHLTDNGIVSYSGVVDNGILTIIVNNLSPFMVEVPANNTHAITVNAGTGGSVTPSGTINVADSTDKTFTFLPNAGYTIDTVKINDSFVNFSGNSYTIENITNDTSLDVKFRKVASSNEYHTVTTSMCVHGSISPSAMTQVQHGLAQTFYFYPNNGYELDKVWINGVEVNVLGNSYTISAVDTNTTVSATFRNSTTQPPNVYKTIFADAGENGSISPMGNTSVEYGGGMYFYFIPNNGYEVDKVLIDGEKTAVSGNAYHFINVIDDRTIEATFKKSAIPPKPDDDTDKDNNSNKKNTAGNNTSNEIDNSKTPLLQTKYHTISVSVKGNGKIEPSGNLQVVDGGSQNFYLIADDGYEVDAIYLDGKRQDVSGSQFNIDNVTDDMGFKVTFKPDGSHALSPTFNIIIYICLATIIIALTVWIWYAIIRRRKKEERTP